MVEACRREVDMEQEESMGMSLGCTWVCRSVEDMLDFDLAGDRWTPHLQLLYTMDTSRLGICMFLKARRSMVCSQDTCKKLLD